MNNITRATILSAIVLYFIWIIPLGAFIKPSQEKFACGGKRAICLCNHIDKESKSNSAQECSFQVNPGPNEEINTSNGQISQYYLATHIDSQQALNSVILNTPLYIGYHNPFFKSIEHVPKVRV